MESDANNSQSNSKDEPVAQASEFPSLPPPLPAKVEPPLKAPRHKCLKSPLLTPHDIANEILERSQKKNPPKLPEKGDVIFTMKLAQRLAKRVVKPDPEPLEGLSSPKMAKAEKPPDLEARELLAVLQDGAESHYLDKPKPKPRVQRNIYKMDGKIDPEMEKTLALKQLMEFSRSRGRPKKESNNNTGESSTSEDKRRKKVCKSAQNRELQKLLQDEGAINMLYAIKKGEPDTKDGLLPSKRRMKKALIKKAQEVKEALLDGSATDSGVSLRHRTSNADTPKGRKDSVDSVESDHTELPANFTFQSPADGSKIIRRHSSSSSYSSRSNSPRRMSMERDRSPGFVPKMSLDSARPNGRDSASSPVSTGYISPGQVSAETSPVKKLTQNGLKERLQSEIATKLKSAAKPIILQKQFLRPNPPKNKSVWQLVQEDWSNPDDPDPLESSSDSPVKIPNKVADSVATVDGELYFRRLPDSVRNYRELLLRQLGNLSHIVLSPVSTYIPQAFNAQVLRELTMVLDELSKDSECHAILITSNGPCFSNGIDLAALINCNIEARKTVAFEMASAIKQFACKLCMMKKPVIAGVNGPAVGLGTVMLAYCDLVFATEKAVFYTPYAELGQVPEAAATVALTHAVGNRMANSLLLGSRKLNSADGLRCGLISRILPKENFLTEVSALCSTIASQSPQSMESSKALLLHSLRTRLESVLNIEVSLLQQHWISEDCQSRIKIPALKFKKESLEK